MLASLESSYQPQGSLPKTQEFPDERNPKRPNEVSKRRQFTVRFLLNCPLDATWAPWAHGRRAVWTCYGPAGSRRGYGAPNSNRALRSALVGGFLLLWKENSPSSPKKQEFRDEHNPKRPNEAREAARRAQQRITVRCRGALRPTPHGPMGRRAVWTCYPIREILPTAVIDQEGVPSIDSFASGRIY